MALFPLLVAGATLAAASLMLAAKGAGASPLNVASLSLLVCGGLTMWPQMAESGNRNYPPEFGTQLYLLVSTLPFLFAAWITRRPIINLVAPVYSWHFLPEGAWLFIFTLVCVADPVISWLAFGKVGLSQGYAGMGAGGGAHSEVFTPLTYIAWASCAAVCCVVFLRMVACNLSFSQLSLSYPSYVLMMVVSLVATTLSGNRFILLGQVALLICLLSLQRRLQWRWLAAVVFAGVMFFVLIGNIRFGAVDVRDFLASWTGLAGLDFLVGWVVTYFEPSFANLDNFLHDPPGPLLGAGWVSSVLPSGVVDALGMQRMNAIQWMVNQEQLAYRGMTFRTWYPDFVTDFGVIGSQVVVGLIVLAAAYIYNAALSSPRALVLFCVTAPVIFFAPFLAAAYQMQIIGPFLLLLLIRGSASPHAASTTVLAAIR